MHDLRRFILTQAKSGDIAMLVAEDMKHIITKLTPDQISQTHHGVIEHNDLIGKPWGSRCQSHLGVEYFLVQPTMRDMLVNLKRRSQIIFPKDIGYILMRLNVGPGSTVIEAGTGSGALTVALAWSVGPEGRVISFDRREDMQTLAQENLALLQLDDRVDLRLADIEQGFENVRAMALFMDIPNPEDYLPQVRQALLPGGTLGAFLPTTNQVSRLLQGLRDQNFGMLDVCEIMLRFYKVIPQRVRPVDRMVAHTGYLVFGRRIQEAE
jgi:tRNA (adenine57-N1/adenine58-N1)-methyltransferase